MGRAIPLSPHYKSPRTPLPNETFGLIDNFLSSVGRSGHAMEVQCLVASRRNLASSSKVSANSRAASLSGSFLRVMMP